MNRMIGLFIGLGPILMFVVFAFLWPDVEEGLELVEALMANQTLSTFYLLCGLFGFTMMLQKGGLKKLWQTVRVKVLQIRMAFL